MTATPVMCGTCGIAGGHMPGCPDAAPPTKTPAVVATTTAPVPPVPANPLAAPARVQGQETNASAVAAREKAAVEARYVIAMHRPRSFDTARVKLLTACERPGFAEAARYAKPIGGKDKATGLSIRFAEEARVLWGNMDVAAYVTFEDDTLRVYQITATDLESNSSDSVPVVVEKYVERRQLRDGMEVLSQRTNTAGQVVYRIRATEDDLLNKVNQLVAKARRNVILALIPADLKDECEDRIIATLKHRDAKDPEGARKAIMESFWKLGVTPAQIGELLGKPVEQINPAELELLRSLYTAIKDGETTWGEAQEAFAEKRATKPAAGGTLKDRVKAGAPPKAPEAEDLAEDARITAQEAARAGQG